MTQPWDEFADALREFLDGSANVYAAAGTQIAAPAIVLRPDDPWIVPDGFAWNKETYVAVCIALASDPASSIATLYRLVRSVIAATADAEGFALVDVSGPVVDESTGGPFLAARVRLAYRSSTSLEDPA